MTFAAPAELKSALATDRFALYHYDHCTMEAYNDFVDMHEMIEIGSEEPK